MDDARSGTYRHRESHSPHPVHAAHPAQAGAAPSDRARLYPATGDAPTPQPPQPLAAPPLSAPCATRVIIREGVDLRRPGHDHPLTDLIGVIKQLALSVMRSAPAGARERAPAARSRSTAVPGAVAQQPHARLGRSGRRRPPASAAATAPAPPRPRAPPLRCRRVQQRTQRILPAWTAPDPLAHRPAHGRREEREPLRARVDPRQRRLGSFSPSPR